MKGRYALLLNITPNYKYINYKYGQIYLSIVQGFLSSTAEIFKHFPIYLMSSVSILMWFCCCCCCLFKGQIRGKIYQSLKYFCFYIWHNLVKQYAVFLQTRKWTHFGIYIHSLKIDCLKLQTWHQYTYEPCKFKGLN